MSTVVMGQSVSMPVLISPTGVQAVHPDGEVAVARAAAARGVAMGLSSFASKPIEDVIAANPQTFFQIYWAGDRDSIVARMERARAAGAVGMILTLDWSFVHSRDWGSPQDPAGDRPQDRPRARPRVRAASRAWLLEWARSRSLPDLTVPNFAVGGESAARILRGLRRLDADAAPDVGRHRLAARAVGRPVHGQGHRPRRRSAPRGRRRRVGDLGVEPRRQQPRRHAGRDPGAARGRRRGRRRDRSR